MTTGNRPGVDEALRKHGLGWVLVVEDDDMLREGIVDFIEQEGYSAVGVPHGRAALDYLASAPLLPKLVLLDLMLPIMDGWQLINELRRDDKLAPIPLVVMSAHLGRQPPGSPASVVARVLEKPLDVDMLREAVVDACGPL